MRLPRLSSFNIIGVILLGIGLYGLWRGPRFAFDPGTPTEHGEAFYYIFVGILMIVNSFFWMKPVASSAKESDSQTVPSDKK